MVVVVNDQPWRAELSRFREEVLVTGLRITTFAKRQLALLFRAGPAHGRYRLGEEAVVGAGSVVIRSVKPFDRVVGVPAHSIKSKSS